MDGKLLQKQAAAHVRATPRAARAPVKSVRVNAGRFRFAELTVGEAAIRVNFFAGIDMAQAQLRMEALLKEMAAEAAAEAGHAKAS
jgi:hypothetical protein